MAPRKLGFWLQDGVDGNKITICHWNCFQHSLGDAFRYNLWFIILLCYYIICISIINDFTVYYRIVWKPLTQTISDLFTLNIMIYFPRALSPLSTALTTRCHWNNFVVLLLKYIAIVSIKHLQGLVQIPGQLQTTRWFR